MNRLSPKAGPRLVVTAIFGASLLLFGSVAWSWHPAAPTLSVPDLSAASALLADVSSGDAPIEPEGLVEAEEAELDTGLIGESPTIEAAPVPLPGQPAWVEHVIQRGETLGEILPEYGAPVDVIRKAAKEHYDLSKLRAGAVLGFYVDPAEAQPLAIRYRLSADRTLMLERASVESKGKTTTEWSSRVDEVIYERRTGLREFVVESSLWGAAVAAGLRPTDIAGLAEVYRFDIDFNTEIRPGARARMVVEELWLDGSFVRLGAPQAVRLENDGKEYVAIRYQDGEKAPAYYDVKGRSRKKPFLRSPLKFSKVTSGFNLARFHPVLKKKRPHYGVDFGAPTGTPVYAVGSGKITVARVSGGHGRFVKIDHPGPYESSYSHLSRIAVREGQAIKQGQVIGYVGSTGLATGPHLHYQFWVNGRYVNPLTVKLPNDGAEDIRDTAAFAAARDRLMALLEGGIPGSEEPIEDDIPVADAL